MKIVLRLDIDQKQCFFMGVRKKGSKKDIEEDGSFEQGLIFGVSSPDAGKVAVNRYGADVGIVNVLVHDLVYGDRFIFRNTGVKNPGQDNFFGKDAFAGGVVACLQRSGSQRKRKRGGKRAGAEKANGPGTGMEIALRWARTAIFFQSYILLSGSDHKQTWHSSFRDQKRPYLYICILKRKVDIFLKNFQKIFNGSVFWDKNRASRDSRDVNENKKTIIKNNNVSVYKSIQKGHLNMKKTHIYGAVAAAMLLAPVTAQALAKEGELPDPTAVQEGEEAVVIDTTAAEKTAADKGNQEKNLDLDPVKTSAPYTGTMSTTPETDAKEVQGPEVS